MDEPKNKQDSSSGDSSAKTEVTSEQPKTFTEEDMKKVVSKAVNDALSKAGRDEKAIKEREDKLKQTIDSNIATQEASRKQRREAELEAAKEDDAVVKALKRRHEVEDREAKIALKEAELERRTQESEQAGKEVAQSTKEQKAREIATRLNVDLEPLVKFTDGSEEAMVELAGKLPKIDTPTVDSGGTTGGSGGLTIEQVKKMTPAEVAKNAKEIAKLPLTLGSKR